LQSKYFQINPIRRQQDPNAVQRGMAVGQDIGKLLGGLAGAIKGAQKDAIANKLMTDESIGEQPGAGVTQDLGKLPPDGSDASSSSGAPIDLGTAPGQTFTNPSTGDVQTVQQIPGEDVNQLRQAMVASQLQSSSAPTTSTLSDDDLRRAMAGGPQPAASRAASGLGGSDFSLNPSDYSAGGTAFGDKGSSAGTVGGLIHTGGTQELDLQKEILAMRLAKQKAAADAADDAAKAAGTGRYALENPIRRAQLENIQSEIAARKNKPVKEEKNPPAANIASEPVIDQNQLNKHIDGIYGNGVASKLASSINESPTLPDGTPNLNFPVVTADSVSVPIGPNKTISMPLAEAQAYVKQANALRLKQGLPAYRVPGEDQTVGSTAANPYPAKNNLDVYSRAPGTWVRLPNGKVAQVPERRQ
jgi:hypothetical protein